MSLLISNFTILSHLFAFLSPCGNVNVIQLLPLRAITLFEESVCGINLLCEEYYIYEICDDHNYVWVKKKEGV